MMRANTFEKTFIRANTGVKIKYLLSISKATAFEGIYSGINITSIWTLLGMEYHHTTNSEFVAPTAREAGHLLAVEHADVSSPKYLQCFNTDIASAHPPKTSIYSTTEGTQNGTSI